MGLILQAACVALLTGLYLYNPSPLYAGLLAFNVILALGEIVRGARR